LFTWGCVPGCQQAQRFNTAGTGYDVLVASDAVGMGLNLNIRRVIFHSLLKAEVLAEGGASPGVDYIDPGMVKQVIKSRRTA
jgi:hypothetical protein